MQFDRSCSMQNTLNERRFQQTMDQLVEFHKKNENASSISLLKPVPS